MTHGRRLQVSPIVAVTAVVIVLAIGAGGMYFVMRNDGTAQSRPADVPTMTPAAPPPSAAAVASVSAALPDVIVPLTKEAADRAGIGVGAVTTEPIADTLRVPGVVEPNAYRQVAVTPLVAGRIVRVSAELGERVRRGQSIAQVYSPELAEARTKYVAAKAMLEAHDRELQRTQKLVDIGAASRQELERIHAEHAAQTAEVESAGARLRLLGVKVGAGSSTNTQGGATTNVPAPIDGVVTEREANVGLNVDSTTKLFTIVDLSSVWIVADVYERDLSRVREGARATITTVAFPEQPLEGRVSFIDPQLNAATRTAKVRVEVANSRGTLRLGMYTDVVFQSPGTTSALAVPKDAIQSVGERQVVYLVTPNDPSRFIERDVRLGRTFGDRIEVLEGLSSGDRVVSKGSFFVRAEAERLGLRGSQRSTAVQTATVAVTEKGFEPDKVSFRSGVRARLTFVRMTNETCATEVVFPSLNVKRALPLNQPVVIDFTPAKTGDLAFACGMNMLKGVAVVQ